MFRNCCSLRYSCLQWRAASRIFDNLWMLIQIVTWYDVHQMLTDVTKDNYNAISKFEDNKKGPISFWRELVPPGRGCEDANIPILYCVCGQLVHLDPLYDGELWWAGRQLVKYANEQLTHFANCRGNCRGRTQRESVETLNEED